MHLGFAHSNFYCLGMHKQHHKMHGEEIAFHLAVPLIMLMAVAAMGYYVVMLFTSLFKMA